MVLLLPVYAFLWRGFASFLGIRYSVTSRIHASGTPRSSFPTPVMEVEMARVVRGRRGGMASAVAGEKKVVLMVLWELGVLGVLRGVVGLFLTSDFFSSSFEVLRHQRSMTLGRPGANAPDRPPGTDIRPRPANAWGLCRPLSLPLSVPASLRTLLP